MNAIIRKDIYTVKPIHTPIAMYNWNWVARFHCWRLNRNKTDYVSYYVKEI